MKKGLLQQMHRHQYRNTGDIKKQSSRILPKELNNFPELDPDLKESYELPETEFKIIIVKKFNVI